MVSQIAHFHDEISLADKHIVILDSRHPNACDPSLPLLRGLNHHFPSSPYSHPWSNGFPSFSIIFHHFPSFSIIFHHFPSFFDAFPQRKLLSGQRCPGQLCKIAYSCRLDGGPRRAAVLQSSAAVHRGCSGGALVAQGRWPDGWGLGGLGGWEVGLS